MQLINVSSIISQYSKSAGREGVYIKYNFLRWNLMILYPDAPRMKYIFRQFLPTYAPGHQR